MRKHFLTICTLLMIAVMGLAETITPSVNIPKYWAPVDGKSGSELWKAVSATTNVGFKSVGYKGLYAAYIPQLRIDTRNMQP